MQLRKSTMDGVPFVNSLPGDSTSAFADTGLPRKSIAINHNEAVPPLGRPESVQELVEVIERIQNQVV